MGLECERGAVSTLSSLGIGLLHESGSIAAVAGCSLGRRQAGRGKAEEDGAQDYSHWLITHLLVLPKQPHWPGPTKSRQG
jgi:hypothetical protein